MAPKIEWVGIKDWKRTGQFKKKMKFYWDLGLTLK